MATKKTASKASAPAPVITDLQLAKEAIVRRLQRIAEETQLLALDFEQVLGTAVFVDEGDAAAATPAPTPATTAPAAATAAAAQAEPAAPAKPVELADLKDQMQRLQALNALAVVAEVLAAHGHSRATTLSAEERATVHAALAAHITAIEARQ